MKTLDKTIPITVGVTGHRAVREEDREALRKSVAAVLEKLQADFPDSRIRMLTNLAEGADLLCADAAAEMGIPVLAALPMPEEEFERDFTPAARERLAFHLGRAEEVFVAPRTEREPGGGINRDYLFRQAGIYVASHSHVLLALWDGGPGTPAACGTAEAVDFALHGDYAPASGIPVRSENNTGVLHIFTPRGDRCGEAAGTVHFLGNREAVEEILRKTDTFNRLSKEKDPEEKSRLPQESTGDPKLLRMDRIGTTAGSLSGENETRFRKSLALLAASCMILTFAFLMYDEAQAIWMILICGIMLLGAWACQRYASRTDCHRRYIEYRALAESLRVQTYLRYAGTGIEASGLLSWTQQEETAWVMAALCSLTAGAPPEKEHDIREIWVEDQRRYHQWAEKHSLHDLRVSETVVQYALICSVALYISAVLFELLCGGLSARPIIGVGDVEKYRTLLKILLGTLSVITLFIADYYGRMSVSRIYSDHQKMERFYGYISEQLVKRGQSDELLEVLAREELVENGNWYSYQKDNKLDLGL